MTDALDPTTADPRALMQMLLPAARAEYIKAWELLADASTTLQRRRVARTRAAAIADDHSVVSAFLRERAATLSGDDLLNARHLADELDRHIEALTKIATISAVGVRESAALRPEALGCGKRYRDSSRTSASPEAGSTRPVADRPSGQRRDSKDQRRDDRPFNDRGPKVSKDALGSSKHDSPLSDDLDAETRARLQALRDSLGG